MSEAIKKYCLDIQLNAGDLSAQDVATNILKMLLTPSKNVSIPASDLRSMTVEEVFSRLNEADRIKAAEATHVRAAL